MSFKWLPNAISMMRIVLVAPILVLILQGRFGGALVLFWLAGFSDGLDGYLAKRFDWHTRLGALLDPIADKLLVAGMFVTLAYTADIPVWLAVVVISRDIVIVAGAIAYNYFVRPLQGEPTRVSKLNTALQLLFLLFVLSRAGYGWPDQISITVLGASVLITVVISGIDYVWSWSRRARRGE
ncbi:MAG: CDP-alcohol phosphatidyltransferase family protein [Woeseiaceae bacterium]|nr:CDP-alcohol phosphatidyltransferase family protein [Woeseiaceae bacterium]